MKFLQYLFHNAIRIISTAFLSDFYYTIWLYLSNLISERSLPVISITFCIPGTPSSCLLLTDFITYQSCFTTLLVFFLISKQSVKILKVLRLVLVEPPHPSTAPFQCNFSSSLKAVPYCFTVWWLVSIFSSLPFNHQSCGTESNALPKSNSWDVTSA